MTTLLLRYKNPRQRALEAAWRLDGREGGGYATEQAREIDVELFYSYFEGIMYDGFMRGNTLLK